MQAENIHKNVDEITINDFVTKNDKDVLELEKHVLVDSVKGCLKA